MFGSHQIHHLQLHSTLHHPSTDSLLVEPVDRSVTLGVLLEDLLCGRSNSLSLSCHETESKLRLVTHLGDGHLKVLLPDVLPPLPQSVHSSFGTDPSDFGTGTVTHLLGQGTEVDSSLEGHL